MWNWESKESSLLIETSFTNTPTFQPWCTGRFIRKIHFSIRIMWYVVMNRTRIKNLNEKFFCSNFSFIPRYRQTIDFILLEFVTHFLLPPPFCHKEEKTPKMCYIVSEEFLNSYVEYGIEETKKYKSFSFDSRNVLLIIFYSIFFFFNHPFNVGKRDWILVFFCV